MKFSVLIPTLNRLDLLKLAVETVRRQDYDNWEIIISDNCSDADVPHYVASLKDDRIKCFRPPTRVPVTDNWNLALEKSSGDYVIMLGDDDCLMSGYLSRMATVIREFSQPDLLFTAGYIFSYPGVHPSYPGGFLQSFRHAMFRESAPFLLDQPSARAIVENSLRFRMSVAFNMQYSLVSRGMIQELQRHGPFFQSPYPDFYATNALFLCAQRVVVYPKPWVTIGISKQSYGYFHFNNREEAGTRFLGNTEFRGASSAALAQLIPGSRYLTSWLLALDRLCANFSGTHPMQPDYRRYRLLQIAGALKHYYLDRRLKHDELQAILRDLTLLERLAISLPCRLAFGTLRLFPRRLQERVINVLARKSVGQADELGRGQVPGQFETILDVFEKVAVAP